MTKCIAVSSFHPFPNTVDTIKTGDPDQTVQGIVTTMFATNEVIGKNPVWNGWCLS